MSDSQLRETFGQFFPVRYRLGAAKLAVLAVLSPSLFTWSQSPTLTPLNTGPIITSPISQPSTSPLPTDQTTTQNLDLSDGTSRTSTGQNSNSSQNGQTSQKSDRPQQQQQPTVLLPPEPPTAFQRLVTNTTGVDLPLFGHDLFTRPPSTFAPVNDIPVTPDYVIGPGDEIQIQIWGAVNHRGSYTVSRRGDITLPDAGTVHVAGIRYSDLQNYLQGQFQRVLRNFQLSASLGQLRSIQVFVVGNVRQPGAYTVSSLSTLVNALFASGGPSSTGSLRHIQLKRGDSSVQEFDLYALLLRGDKSKDARLEPGDVIYIPPVGHQVALVGGVSRPAIYEIKDETTAQQVLTMAGGLTVTAVNEGLRLERIINRSQRSVTDIALNDAGKNTPIQDGDIISISSLVDRFANAVTLRGNVASPGRYAWHPGMHVSDLIPNKDALLTRDYWARHNQQAILITTRGGEGTIPLAGTQQGNAAAPEALAASATDNNSNAQGTFAARNEVNLDAAEVDWNYAVIERLNRDDLTTSLIPFNLGKVVIDKDAAADPELKDGDVITIFSKSDVSVPQMQRTRFVRLEGEIVAAGVYSVRPGETLRDLVQRAGGITQDAYLYGSQFTRQSTQRTQQARLNEYLNQIEVQLTSAAINTNSKALNDRDIQVSDSSRAAAQSLVNRLRGTTASGRIVLDFQPGSTGVNALPDLQLEDGDRFIVPRRPDSVSVAGSVYNQNDFLFTAKRDTKYYLQKAGGPGREADSGREFIIRADGSILSRQYTDSPFRHGFDKAEIFPGDTIVVPQRIRTTAPLRTLLDLSQIVAQFGLGVAAIRVLN